MAEVTVPASNPLLTSRNFRLYWLAQVINLLGDSFTGMARMWILLEMTNSSLSQGVNLAIATLPTVVLAPLVASWVDRLRRKPVLIYSDLARFVLDLGLVWIVSGTTVSVWHLHLFTLLQSLVRVLYAPSQTAFIPLLVRRDQLMKANGLQQLGMYVAMVVGPLLAGKALARYGAVTVIIVDAASFLLSAALTQAIRLQEHISSSQQSNRKQQLAEGWRYVVRNRWIIYLTGSFLLVNMSGAVSSVILPLLVKNQFGQNADGVGLMSSFRSAGSVLGALLVSTLALRGRRQRMLTAAMAAAALFGLLLAFAPVFWAFLAVCLLCGVSGPIMGTISNSTYHETIPPEYQGRVSLFRHMVATCMQPVTFLLVGRLGDTVSYRTSLLAAASLTAVGTVIVATLVRFPALRQTEQAAD